MSALASRILNADVMQGEDAMSRDRVVEYANALSNGPVGREYLLPFTGGKPDGLSPWAQRFVNLSPDNVFTELCKQWEPATSITTPFVDFFATLEPTSIYLLPDPSCPNRDWLLLKNRTNVFFFAEASAVPETLPAFGEHLALLLRAFNGTRIGFRMDDSERFLRQDSGFMSGDQLRVISRSDDSRFWGDDESLFGCLPFFETPCGNVLLAIPSGEIAKWDHDSTTMSVCFRDTSEFVNMFVSFYAGVRSDADSPFYY